MAGSRPARHARLFPIRRLIAVINLLLAVVVPLWINAVAPKLFAAGDEYVLGVLLFIALTMLELFILAERAFEKELRITEIWDARESLDARLQEVRRLFHEVEERRVGATDLFVSYFNKKLADLESSLRDACSKSEIRIDETMLEVTTWLLYSSFLGRSVDLFRAIHFTIDNPFFVDFHSKRYFCQVLDMVGKGQIKEVRRLLVYGDNQELQDPITLKIIAFHHHVDHYECRTLPLDVFMRIVRDYTLHNLVKDFGIYGRSYLYKGIVNKSEEIVGTYSRDVAEIDRYIDCFETCWESAQVPPMPDNLTNISIDILFERTSVSGQAASTA